MLLLYLVDRSGFCWNSRISAFLVGGLESVTDIEFPHVTYAYIEGAKASDAKDLLKSHTGLIKFDEPIKVSCTYTGFK